MKLYLWIMVCLIQRLIIFGHMERRMYFWTYGKTFVLSLGHMERHYFGHMERHYVGHMERQTS